MNTKNSKRSSSAEPASDRTIDLDHLVDDPKADLPTVDAMMTPAQRSRDNILHLRATEKTLQQRIKELEFDLSIVEAQNKNRLQDANIPLGHPRRLLCRNLLDLTAFSLSLNALLTLPTDKS